MQQLQIEIDLVILAYKARQDDVLLKHIYTLANLFNAAAAHQDKNEYITYQSKINTNE